MDQQTKTDKDTLAANIDTIVLIGHAVGELSRAHRKQIRLVLKANESSSHSDLLFGTDLANQVCDAKDTNRIDKAAGKTGGQVSHAHTIIPIMTIHTGHNNTTRPQ